MQDDLRHIIGKSRDAERGGFGALSTGEKLAAALVLNRFDWLVQMDYTIAEAIERIGPNWATLIPDAAKQLECDFDSLQAKLRDNAADILEEMQRQHESSSDPSL
ncbi:hypothetical protein Q6A26_19065 [Xanthomonas euvesicatoria pv. eucalypti]|uniref:hypothetical protein n=1 Tax=Xanthomonas euvesicatoria TaxID=456327 RepID=UPI0026E36298|nr:hypothetical protein [Xanthomonas euvesicatoria]MDO7931070.1 hypothetical protein [Xanthomonas euvesicatoria pv. eucalypti]MDO7938328.1 hypothetical protein [Xanthomonas euvesicatoria pv. eucalypti]MDO7940509.1 hypothetical protein [Xanthomonas euvesicatoria pv. eucalypti]MDO7945131.1 hypothetical protein [Xanthomonas euvesicatoria pv. eucalypti]MDO7954909.1 hypothetical protein [Xanthomonas euvesicatoria pv. eucalypti]